LDAEAAKKAELYSLCQGAGGGGGASDSFGRFTYGNTGGDPNRVIPDVTNDAGYDIESDPSIVTLSFPNLTAIDPTNTQGGYFVLTDCANVTSLSAPSLATVQGSFDINSNPVLASVDLGSLQTCGGGQFRCYGNASLVTIGFGAFVPPNGWTIKCDSNALNAATVNLILARCVANAGYVSGSIDVSSGTNAAPTGQGILDKATLIGRGVTVNTN
jgi:hypothetical protein